MNTKELIEEAKALPADQRVKLADAVLQSLQSGQSGAEEAWSGLAEKRLHEFKPGQTKTSSADVVFEELAKRLQK